MILQRARDDLGGRGRVSVGQDHDRDVRGDGVGFGDVALRRAEASAHTGEFPAARHEEVRHLERLIEEATGVPAQVDHEPLGALGLQTAQRLGELLGGRLVELLDGDVGGVVLEHQGEGDRRDADGAAGELHLERLGHAGALEARLHLGPWGALEAAGDLVDAPTARGLRVDADDAVTLADASLLGGSVRIDLADHDGPFVVLDQHADATVEAAGGGVEHFELLGGVELGIGVLELRHEPARGLLVQRGGVHGIDEPVADDREHLIEQPGARSGRLFLDSERPSHHGDEDDAEQRELSGTTHWARTY